MIVWVCFQALLGQTQFCLARPVAVSRRLISSALCFPLHRGASTKPSSAGHTSHSLCHNACATRALSRCRYGDESPAAASHQQVRTGLHEEAALSPCSLGLLPKAALPEGFGAQGWMARASLQPSSIGRFVGTPTRPLVALPS